MGKNRQKLMNWLSFVLSLRKSFKFFLLTFKEHACRVREKVFKFEFQHIFPRDVAPLMSLMSLLKGLCHAIFVSFQKAKSVFASTEFQK